MKKPKKKIIKARYIKFFILIYSRDFNSVIIIEKYLIRKCKISDKWINWDIWNSKGYLHKSADFCETPKEKKRFGYFSINTQLSLVEGRMFDHSPSLHHPRQSANLREMRAGGFSFFLVVLIFSSPLARVLFLVCCFSRPN